MTEPPNPLPGAPTPAGAPISAAGAPVDAGDAPGPATGAPAAGATPRGRAAALVALVLALAGAGVAAFLVREHLAVTQGDLARGLFCGGSGQFDCGRVAADPSSWLLGMPVAFWGLAFYFVTLGLALGALVLRPAERAAAASLGTLLALTAVIFDAWLAWVMVTQIGSICLNCVATYAINLLLLVAFWRLEQRIGAPPDLKALALAWRSPAKIAIALGVAGAIAAATVWVWRPLAETRQFAREETLEFLDKTTRPPEIDMARFAGLPSRGPDSAPVTIVVAGDFQCHYCRALSANVERLRRELPGRIRVVFLQSPVSSLCNPGIKENVHEDACWLAEVGEAAAMQGRFWEYHDFLYHHLSQPQVTRANVEPRLAEIGLDPARVKAALADGSARARLGREVGLANQLKLIEVPSIVINGHARRAGVYPDMLRSVVHVMLARL